jgi:hypothetical protein
MEVRTMASLIEQAQAIRDRFPDEIARIKADMQKLYVPAQRSINAGFARMGVARFTRSGDDLWERLVALENGWEYERPARYLIDRWAAY